MTGDSLLVFVVLGITIALFASGRLRLDVIALMSLVTLLLLGILTPQEALAGFSDSAVIMIAALFVLGAAMLATGLAERFGRAIGRLAGKGRARLTAILMAGTAVISAFVSTTGTVALMLPVTAALARNAGLSPSVLLMPMSVAALLGGLLTLIATAPNIIVSEQLAAAGYEPFSFFGFTPVGVVMLLIGMALLIPLAGRLLPPRAPADAPAAGDGVTRVSGEELVRGYGIGEIGRARVTPQSPLVGNTTRALGIRHRYGVSVLSVRRRAGRSGRRQRLSRTTEEVMAAGDELELRGSTDAVTRLCDEMGLELVGFRSEPDAVLAEVLLTPRSRLVGQTLVDASFRTRYMVNVLSLRRGGKSYEGDMATEPLRFADTLLVAGSPARIEQLRREYADLVVVAQSTPLASERSMSAGELAVITIICGMIGLLALNLVPAVVAVLLAALCVVLFRCVDMETAYRSVNWQSVVLIAAMLPMATALRKTGGIDLVIELLSPVLLRGPVTLMAGIFLLTALLGMFISNTATAVLVAPVAIGAAAQLGVSPYPIMMAVAVAASTSFATPVATPVNLLVLGPGSYTFGDFARVGLLVQGCVLVATLLLVPRLFPF